MRTQSGPEDEDFFDESLDDYERRIEDEDKADEFWRDHAEYDEQERGDDE